MLSLAAELEAQRRRHATALETQEAFHRQEVVQVGRRINWIKWQLEYSQPGSAGCLQRAACRGTWGGNRQGSCLRGYNDTAIPLEYHVVRGWLGAAVGPP